MSKAKPGALFRRWLDDKSPMNREVHVGFWEGVGVRFPRATRLLRIWSINEMGWGEDLDVHPNHIRLIIQVFNPSHGLCIAHRAKISLSR